jgi:hypothetical protein
MPTGCSVLTACCAARIDCLATDGQRQDHAGKEHDVADRHDDHGVVRE